MAGITAKQQKFIEAKASGLSNRAAGLLAGYTIATVDQAVSRLAARADIKKAIAVVKRSATVEGKVQATKYVKDHYDSPLDILNDVMNCPELPLGLRIEAAKQMLPYKCARIGEKGKKEKKQDEAHQVVGRGKFGSKAPPTRGNVVAIRP